MIKGFLRNIFFFILIELLCLQSLFLAQYSRGDSALVNTTFEREFDKNILLGYLSSKEYPKVVAGLLSISHSADTTFVDQIIKLDFDTYGNYIAFALGQIGPSSVSIEFLLKELSLLNTSVVQKSIFDALGKIGNQQTLDTLIKNYLSNSIPNEDGISIALANFNVRGIQSTNRKELTVLKNEITTDPFYAEKTIEALYALYRIGPDESFKDDLINTLYLSDFHDKAVLIKQYSLGSLRKIKYFPNDFSLLKELLRNNDWRIRTEAVKVACFYNFTNEDELSFFLSLLKDENPNVARQCAISLRSLSLNNDLKTFLKNDITDRLENSGTYTSNTAGELFISFTSLFPTEIFVAVQKYEKRIKPKYFYTAFSENSVNPERNLDYLLNKNLNASLPDKIEILNALLSLQTHLPANIILQESILGFIASHSAPLISIASEGIDSILIDLNKDKIKEIILSQIHTHLNESNYSESIISLALLANKTDRQFYQALLSELEKSELYSIKKWIMNERGIKVHLEKPSIKFDEIWQNAFRYNGVRIITNKGNFEIQFAPEVSPISVGNFCYLASRNFFDNLIFHRVVPNFVIQTGDPDGTGWGGSGYEIVSECSPIEFDEGNVGMASSGKDTESSQWFVMHNKFPHLNGRYSNFGRITSGQNIVNIIDQDDYIISTQLLQ
ncbi:MAG: hypothetical protein C4539_04500 [Ignavibacteriales bacterium]|nr:MAG: hypothetical protein C4539_04500 [Ignavibacteriales bacterium]